MLTAASIAFGILFLHYGYFLFTVYKGLNRLTRFPEKAESKKYFVSVIVPFRNEENEILNSLKSIENQNYDENFFEVIYVDDSSTDNSLKILRGNINRKNIKVIEHNDNSQSRAHKKKVIEHAIEKSQGEIIVTTDADCTHGNDWLTSMVNCFDEETGFVSGPVEFLPGESFFEKLQALEFAGLIITGAGLIGAGRPAICNAANLAFRKSAFYDVGGYSGNLNLSSGDDEFLMQKIHADTNYKVKFCADKRAKVFTKPAPDLTGFYQQRKRWASKGLFYKNKKLVISLILIFLFYFGLFLFPLFAMLMNGKFWLLFAAGFVLKIVTEFIVMNKGIKILYNTKMLKYFPAAEIFHIPYIVIASLSGLKGNFEWKGRELSR